jgi:alpha-ketoglutarate-dependent taurine dioxygenase
MASFTAQFHRVARRVGVPEPRTIDPFRHPEIADILILSNVRRDGRPIGLADGGTCFHTGDSYLEAPARATMPHAATLTGPDDPRTLWRITVKPPGGLPD